MKKLMISVFLTLCSGGVTAADQYRLPVFEPDSPEYQKNNLHRNMEWMQEKHERRPQDPTLERIPKDAESNRYRIDKSQSLGIGKGGINYKYKLR